MESDVLDVAIVGAGPAGLSAAVEARKAGLSVALLDEQPAVGGQIYRGIEAASDQRRALLGDDYVKGLTLAQTFARSGAQHISSASVWNIGRDMKINYLRDGTSNVLQSRSIVLASGAMERPFPIPGWTLPGVMGAGAAQILFKSAGALPLEPVVLAGNGPLLYLLADQYLRAGITLKAVVHSTSHSDYLRSLHHWSGAIKGWRDMRKGLGMLANLRRHGVLVYAGASDFRVIGESRAAGFSFRHGGREHRIDTSLVLLHQGVVPNTQFSWALRAKHRWNDAQLCWVPETDDDGQIEDTGIYIAGDSRGIVGAKASAYQGRLAAMAITSRMRGATTIGDRKRAEDMREALHGQLHIRPFLDALYRPPTSHRVPADPSVIVCRCEEVTAGQIRQYADQGCLGPNQTKAYGRCGMGSCQGRLCGLTVTELIADARGVTPDAVGYYRIRPPIKPVTLGELSD